MNNIEILKEIINFNDYTGKIYRKAAMSVNEDIVQNELNQIAEQRERFTGNLQELLKNYEDSPAIPLKDVTLFENLELILNDLLVRKNVPDVLNSCVKADEALLNKHREIVQHEKMDDDVLKMLNHQFNDILETQHSFRKRLDRYPWFQS